VSFGLFLDQARAGVRARLSEMGLESGFEVGPARPGFGDAACNAPFLLAKKTGRRPADIASELASGYRISGLVSSCEAHPSGYLNFVADDAQLASAAVASALDGTFGIRPAGPVRTVVEHTSVNPNKALHIGHVRNVAVGDSLSRILARAGHPVLALNYVDDSGLQVADVVVGFQKLGFAAEPPGGGRFDSYCGDEVYVKTTAEYEKNPALKEERARVLALMEEGGNETARLAESVTRRVLRCQLDTCWRLGARYDCVNYESQVVRSGMWASVFERLKESGLAELESEGDNAGCWVLKGQDKVLVRSSGTATYTAKDIPYAAWKLGMVADPFGYEEYAGQPGKKMFHSVLGGGQKKDYSGRRVVTVVDSRQSAPQAAVSSLMDAFGEEGAYVHLAYGPVGLSPSTARSLGAETGGKKAQMSGRRGLYVGADSVCDLLEERALSEVLRRDPEMDRAEAAEIARKIAVGTVRYEMVRTDLDRPVTFDLEKSLSLEGDTAPYMQYAHARACRILEKSPSRPDPESMEPARGGPERALVLALSRMGTAVSDAERNLSPKVVARYCRELSVEFNSFYEKARVVGTDPGTDNFRLCLVEAFRLTLESSLDMLGVEAPGRM